MMTWLRVVTPHAFIPFINHSVRPRYLSNVVAQRVDEKGNRQDQRDAETHAPDQYGAIAMVIVLQEIRFCAFPKREDDKRATESIHSCRDADASVHHFIHASTGAPLEHQVDRQHIWMASVRKDHERKRRQQPRQSPVKEGQVVQLVHDIWRESQVHKLEVLGHDHKRHEHDAHDREQRRKPQRLETTKQRQRQHENGAEQQEERLAVREDAVARCSEKGLHTKMVNRKDQQQLHPAARFQKEKRGEDSVESIPSSPIESARHSRQDTRRWFRIN